MTDKEALKLALGALEYHASQTRPIYQTDIAITALKEALAQPEQEPVACIWEKNDGYKSLEWGGLDANEIQEIGLKSYTPLYTHPPQRTWVGLTDQEIWTVLQFRGYNKDTIEIAKAVEAKLRSKNEHRG